MKKNQLPQRFCDDLIPRSDPMRIAYNISMKKKAAKNTVDQDKPHSCVECIDKDHRGCPECTHDFTNLPDCGMECNDCGIRYP